MVEETSISGNATLPAFCMGQPTQRDGYIIVAHDLLHGVEALSTLQNISPRGCALIAAHALECALKSFLCHRRKKKENLEPKDRHDLVTLWNMAYKEVTLGITKAPPDWVKILASGHGPNFYFRYQEGGKDQEGKKTVVHSGQTPALIPMAAELGKLIEMVELAIKD